MRVLVTGRGSIAQRHVRHLRQCLPGVVVGVVSGTGQVDAALEPCDVLASFDDGLRWRPDAVIVASVSSRHAAEWVACVERGLPCLVEKPLVICRAEFAQVRSAWAARKGHVVVAVGCNLRYLPVVTMMRAMLQQGALGTIVRAHLEVGQDLAQWRPARPAADSYSADPARGGGVVLDLVHEIDMALWLLGPLSVHAAVSGKLGPQPIRSDDVHVALLRRENGAPVTVSLDYVSCQPVRRYAIVGDRGTLTCDLMARQLVLEDATGREVLASAPQDFDVAATYARQMADWLAAVNDPSRALLSPMEEALATAALMLDMKEAAA
jgi:predicted dehydrogenase